jgi:hypothetical protein
MNEMKIYTIKYGLIPKGYFSLGAARFLVLSLKRGKF